MANRIRELREERKLTVPAFARVIGMADRTVRHWESGRSNPTSRNASRIARALAIPVSELWSTPAPTTRTQAKVLTEPPSATRPEVKSVEAEDAKRPLLVAAIIPHPDGGPRVLMTGRRYVEEQVWSWPSGHVEEGETPEEAVIRELGEELVIQEPRIVRLLGVVDTHLDVSRWWGRHFRNGYVQHCFQVEVASPAVDVIDHEELSAAEWRTLDQVAQSVSKLPPELSDPALQCAIQATEIGASHT